MRSVGADRRRALAWSASVVLHAAILIPFVWSPPAPEIVRVREAPSGLRVGLVTWSPPTADATPSPPASRPPLADPEPAVVQAPPPVAPPPVTPEPKPERAPIEPAAPAPVQPQITAPSTEPVRPASTAPSTEPVLAEAAMPAVSARRDATALDAASIEGASAAQPRASADEIARYVSRVRGLIDDRKHYPRQAQRRRVEGTVLVRLLLTPVGSVGEVDILDAAHGLLEKATREAVERVDAFPAPPDGVSWIEVAVRYDLDG